MPTRLAIASAASPPNSHGLSTNRFAPARGSVPVNPGVSSGLAGLLGEVSLEVHCAAAACALGEAPEAVLITARAKTARPPTATINTNRRRQSMKSLPTKSLIRAGVVPLPYAG